MVCMPGIWHSQCWTIAESVYQTSGVRYKVKEQDRGSNSESHGTKATKKNGESVFPNSPLVLSFLLFSADGLCRCFERLTVMGHDC